MFEFLLEGSFVLDTLGLPLLFLLLQVINLLLQDFYVEFELLFHFNMVSDLSFVILELRLVLFRR